ncbi:zinc finger protein 135-like isoform X2 [Eublepharis macularius]|uniref:Zinc finger protein 135-like isoform X2 n=1 Tax=Eublepharis macularius TaxID=481883 RepID=A0AA97L937_EUBMA|nr:zinc finger protein 135-like isoform X2 [Eublepharis macularius]
MAGAGAPEMQVAFEDVIVYFSKAEWEMLEKWQKELYWDVVKDNYESLIVVGNPITRSDFIAWFEQQSCIKSQESRAVDPSSNERFRQVTSKRHAEMLEPPKMVGGRSEEEGAQYGDLGAPPPEQVPVMQQGSLRRDQHRPPLEKAVPAKASSTYSQEAPKPYQCRECGKRFRMKGLLRIHQRVSLRKLSLPCPKCSICFPGIRYLRSHQRIHSRTRVDSGGADGLGTCRGSQSEERWYFCAGCGESFHRYLGFLQHQKTHGEVRRWLCIQCGVTFPYQSDLEMHEERHLDEALYSCAPCGENCVCEPSLLLHFAPHLGKRVESSGAGLQEDKSQHWEAKGMQEKPYSCLQCGQRFRLETNLKVHYRYCLKARLQKYRYSGTPAEHQKASDTKAHNTSVPRASGNSSCPPSQASCAPWACSDCGKRFTSRQSLCKHQRRHRAEEHWSAAGLNKSVHPTSVFGGSVAVGVTKKLHKCLECGKRFVYKWQLVMHVKTHAKDNCYPCPFCRESFGCRGSIWKHLRMHLKERSRSGQRRKDFGVPALAMKRRKQGEKKLHVCAECGQSFTQSYFSAHKAWHAGVRYRCLWCGKLSSFKSTGYRHLQHHRDKGDFLTCPKCGNGDASKKCFCLLERIYIEQKPRPPPGSQEEMSRPTKDSCGKRISPDSYK